MVQIAMDAHNGSLTKQSCQTMMKRGMQPSRQNSREFMFTRDPRLKVAGLAMFSKDQVYAYADKISCEYLNIRARPGITFELPEVYGELLDKIRKTSRRFEYHELNGTHHLHMNEGSREEVAKVIREFIQGKKVTVLLRMV
ncbi:probable serine hydrolase [Nilaparvata lugens]|uniref:probable serine hydrolase n=1 Tax=Nilaparvata lugens TaxID=108931 RepID=UPI00193D0935|nr:probable serine hydrolase [Nilaparvata lugens]